MAPSRIVILTDTNSLIDPLVVKLIRLGCFIDIVTKDKHVIREQIVSKKNSSVKLIHPNKFKVKKKYDYIILVSLQWVESKEGRKDGEIFPNNCRLAKRIAKAKSAKTIYLLPFLQSKKTNKQIKKLIGRGLIKSGINSTILYLGQILGNNIKLLPTDYLGRILVEAAVNDRIFIEREIMFNPLSASLAARHVVKSLFSFGSYGNELAVISSGIVAIDLVKSLKSLNMALKVKLTRRKPKVVYALSKGKIVVKQNIEKIIKEAVKRTLANKETLIREKKSDEGFISELGKSLLVSFPKLERKRKIKLVLFFSLIALILFPNFAIYLLGFSQKMTKVFLRSGATYLAKPIYSFTSNSSALMMDFLAILPANDIFDLALRPSETALEVIQREGAVGRKKMDLISNYLKIYDVFFGKTKEDIEKIFSNTSLSLDSLYKEQGFINSEINELKGPGKDLFLQLSGQKDKEKERAEVMGIRRLTEEASEIFGVREDKTYLMVIQNDRELRPTGGTIIAVIFTTISKGRLSNLEVLNTKSIDNQLKGYIQPPGPIEKYVSKNWSLRDANWEAAFPSTAEQIEWFIDKAKDEAVGGVLACDLDFLSQVLKISGPLTLKDDQATIDQDNLSEILSDSKDNEFWNEFLAKLTAELANLKRSQKMLFLQFIIRSLEEKHLQVFLHSVNSQRALSELEWDASLPTVACRNNCFFDWASLVEFSTGGNNLGPFLSRSATLKVSFEEGLIKRRYTVLIENHSGGEKDSYLAYVRLITPQDSGFSPVIVDSKGETKEVIPEITTVKGRKEAGVFIEVVSGENLTLQYSWESPSELDFSKSGEYRFLLRKQAGLREFPTKVEIAMPHSVRTGGKAGLLTESKDLEYNTELSRDFVSRIYW